MIPYGTSIKAALQCYRDYAAALIGRHGSRLSQPVIEVGRQLIAQCNYYTTPNAPQGPWETPPERLRRAERQAERPAEELHRAVQDLWARDIRREIRRRRSRKPQRASASYGGDWPSATPSAPSTQPSPSPSEGEPKKTPDVNDLELVQTSTEGLLCGMWALLGSLQAQLPPAVAPPTTSELRRLFGRLASTADNFYVDDIDAVLREWGLSRGVSLNLGVVMEGPASDGRFSYQIREGGDATIWIHHDNAEALWGAPYSHYSAMAGRAGGG
ncbi:hypothetical protein MAPG_06841 [Magnaporthiopsis poae ATCC 64411]|uniref:Uncharacterized protein n=1 Tax=Magnaporthiopsis poae (strain ATCC 64411 / 73-15) TaxID=644358 RepID=A0A0C4E349_MAGP6|nr:hypothetical protein MAPG_06841 [Magnaporthiopsis poae ATCC 64411]